MVNYIVVGKSRRVVVAVLQAIRSFTDAKCVVIGDHETKSLRFSKMCERQIGIEFNASCDDRLVDVVRSIADRTPHVTVIPADCEGIRMVGRVRDRLQVQVTPAPDLDTLEMFDNKWRFHQFCMQHGLPVPRTQFFESKRELDFDSLAAAFGVPFVLKPINQAGSLGVAIVRSREQFERDIATNPAYCFAPLVAQRFIDGDDIDLSLLAVNGRLSAFAIQQARRARIDFLHSPQLAFLAQELCRVSGYHGVMHIDARREKRTGKVLLIESNPRFWATLTASVWCGLNFVAESISETPRSNGARQLVEGMSSTRHPLMQPSCWTCLFGDRGERGRLLRAIAFDLPALGSFVRELPNLVLRRAGQRVKRSGRWVPSMPDAGMRASPADKRLN